MQSPPTHLAKAKRATRPKDEKASRSRFTTEGLHSRVMRRLRGNGTALRTTRRGAAEVVAARGALPVAEPSLTPPAVESLTNPDRRQDGRQQRRKPQRNGRCRRPSLNARGRGPHPVEVTETEVSRREEHITRAGGELRFHPPGAVGQSAVGDVVPDHHPTHLHEPAMRTTIHALPHLTAGSTPRAAKTHVETISRRPNPERDAEDKNHRRHCSRDVQQPAPHNVGPISGRRTTGPRITDYLHRRSAA